MDERLSQLGFEPYELPADHRQRLDENGYTVFEGVIGEGWLAALRETFDHVFESEGDEAGKEVGLVEGVRRLADLVNKGEVFDQINGATRIVPRSHLDQRKVSDVHPDHTAPFPGEVRHAHLSSLARYMLDI